MDSVINTSMDYLNIYNNLIERGKSRQIEPGLHRHRIIPGHEGGQYIPENISLLTGKEHRIVHRLRWHLFKKIEDKWATRILGGKGIESPNTGRRYKLGPYSEERKAKFRKPKSVPSRLKGKTYVEIYGPEKARQLCELRSQKMMGNQNFVKKGSQLASE
jgi:hypothetical protein